MYQKNTLSYKTLLTFLIYIFLSQKNIAQTAAPTLWQKSDYGAKRFRSINPTKDGGYIATTQITAYQDEILKLDAAGDILNSRLINLFNDFAYLDSPPLISAAIETTDGGYLVLGTVSKDTLDVQGSGWHYGFHAQYTIPPLTSPAYFTTDVWLLKLDSGLNIQWKKCYGGSWMEYGHDVKQTSDGGFIFCASTTSTDGDLTGMGYIPDTLEAGSLGGRERKSCWWVVKTDTSGNIQHQRLIGGPHNPAITGYNALFLREEAYSVWVDSLNGGYTLCGGHATYNMIGYHGNTDVLVVKLNDTLGTTWMKSIGGSRFETALTLTQTKDSNYALLSVTNSIDGDISAPKGGNSFDAWVVKMNSSNGSLIWERTYGGVSDEYVLGEPIFGESFNTDKIRATPDGGFIFTSYTSSTTLDLAGAPTGTKMWLVKANDTGTIQWSYYVLNKSGYSLLAHPDGSYSLAGKKNGDSALLMKFAACPAYTYIDTTICKNTAISFNGQQLATTGIYKDSFQTTFGCDSFITLLLTVDSINQPVITATGNVLSTGIYNSYQWLDANGSSITGATSASYTANSSSAYRVVGYSNTGCSDTSEVYHHFATGISINNNDEWFIFPNPTAENLTISMPPLQGTATAILAGMDGRKLSVTQLMNSKTTIHTSNLPAGIYLLTIKTNQQTITTKIIKR